MLKFSLLSVCLLSGILNTFSQSEVVTGLRITKGQMPNITTDKNNTVHIVYGAGDSIMYIFSRDGKSFNAPSLVALLPELMASAMRGPQIASAENGLVITACTRKGNIFCYKQDLSGKWTKTKRINEANESAREALMALSADGLTVYAIWLGVSGQKGQRVYGSESIDGGKTWSDNILVYASPDGSVCECCKPSAAVKGNNIYVMFRNFIKGNRDLYLIKSTDRGRKFGKAIKMGNGSWKLDGCPMDGGGLVINKNGIPETVWRRKEKIFSASPGAEEIEIGEGRGCSMAIINGKNIFCWSENGVVTVLKPDGMKIKLGKGELPLLKAINTKQVLCIWENQKEIYGSVIGI